MSKHIKPSKTQEKAQERAQEKKFFIINVAITLHLEFFFEKYPKHP